MKRALPSKKQYSSVQPFLSLILEPIDIKLGNIQRKTGKSFESKADFNG